VHKNIDLGRHTSVGIEKRQAHRFAVPSSRQHGELRFGDIHLPVLLFDQSASGFAVLSLLPPGVEIGSEGLLRAGDDWYEIRLVHVKPMDQPESENTSIFDEQVQFFRLGLYRLGDMADPDKQVSTWSWPTLKDHLENVMPNHSSTIGFGMLFVTIVVILPFVAMLLMRNMKGNSVGNEVGLAKSIAATAKFDKKDPDWEKMASGTESEATAILDTVNDADPLGGLANYSEKLAHIIPKNTGAAVFLMPQMVRRLGITDEQKQRLQQIVDETSQLITDLEEQLNGAMSPEQYQKLLNIARNHALETLTDQQRSKWQNITGEKPQNKSVPAAKVDNK
jgi:hypothetical protein